MLYTQQEMKHKYECQQRAAERADLHEKAEVGNANRILTKGRWIVELTNQVENVKITFGTIITADTAFYYYITSYMYVRYYLFPIARNNFQLVIVK